MIKTGESPTHDFFLDYFEDIPIKIARVKATGDILFDIDSVAEALGFADADDMLSDDIIQSSIMEATHRGSNPIHELPNIDINLN